MIDNDTKRIYLLCLESPLETPCTPEINRNARLWAAKRIKYLEETVERRDSYALQVQHLKRSIERKDKRLKDVEMKLRNLKISTYEDKI